MRTLLRWALLAVPRDWRDGVERDLRDEGAGDGRAAGRALAIGARLRAARLREARRLPRARFMRDFGRDFRFALRGVVRRPSYSIAVVATLAIGIGANTAIFSVFNWILFRPVPGVQDPDGLVTIRFLSESRDARFFVSYRDVADLREGMPALSGLAASAALSMNVVFPGADEPERIEGELATSDYFDVLGVTPQLGRRFRPDEERPGADMPAVVISGALWRRVFGADAGVLGRQLTINGHGFAIVGVAPAAFQGRSLMARTDLWVPIGAHAAVMPRDADLLTNRRRTLLIDAVGRLRPGATVDQAQEQARAVARSVPEYGGRTAGRSGGGIQPTIFPGIGLDSYATERLRTVWRLLAGAVGLVLLLACANGANLLLARALGRRREIAVSQAIGASRVRIMRQQLAEGLVLALLAGAGGLVVAQALTWSVDGMRLVSYLPAVDGVAIDWRVGLFTLGAAAVTGVLFSFAPALASSRVDLQSALKDGLTTSRRARGRLRATLVGVQVAVSVLLLVNAGLFMRTLVNVRALDLGVTLDGVTTFSADPTKLGYDVERSQRYFHDLLERLRAAPGIEAAAFAWRLPYSLMASDTYVRRTDGSDSDRHSADTDRVSPGYFRALGVPIVAGRDFTEAELGQETDTAGVVIVSQKLARELFPGGDAVGSSLEVDYPKGKVVEIVGVVGDVRQRAVTNDPEPFVYSPGLSTWGSVAVRSSMPFAQTAAAIRAVARELDVSLPPYDLEPMAVGLDRVISEQRLFARLGGLFAAIAVLLAAVGIYGMMAGAVAERRREFGIRLALGARAESVLALVLRGAVPVTLAGVVAGVAASLALGRLIASRLYGVQPSDPLTLALVTIALALLALGASFVPALRASRVDPVQSLRVE